MSLFDFIFMLITIGAIGFCAALVICATVDFLCATLSFLMRKRR